MSKSPLLHLATAIENGEASTMAFELAGFSGWAELAYFGSLDAAKAFHHEMLPGWSWRAASCCVSDDAWVAPDFNCPINGARLKETVPMLFGHREWHNLTDVDLRPAGNPARAWLLSIVIALGALAK